MKWNMLLSICLSLGAASLAAAQDVQQATHRIHATRIVCPAEPGYQIVECVEYKEITRHVCKLVPEVKKKWVYTCKNEPFCLLGSGGLCHDGCAGCAGPFDRCLLVKKQIELPCGTQKCVVETVKEKLPMTVFRKVRCDAPLEFVPAPPGGEGQPQTLEVNTPTTVLPVPEAKKLPPGVEQLPVPPQPLPPGTVTPNRNHLPVGNVVPSQLGTQPGYSAQRLPRAPFGLPSR
jgi:hypothetical protein